MQFYLCVEFASFNHKIQEFAQRISDATRSILVILRSYMQSRRSCVDA